MASIKIILQTRANKDGKFPLSIRVIKDRKTSYMFIGHALDSAAQWDELTQRVKKTHPNSVRLNNLLLKKLSEANDKLLELEIQKKEHTAKSVINNIKPGQGMSFFTLANTFIDNLRKEGKYNRVNSEEPRIKHFKEYVKDDNLTFQQITVPLLNGFRAYLKATRKVGKLKEEQRSISERTIVNHLMVIRTIYNQALAGGYAEAKDYPFGKGKIPIKFPESVKIGLNVQEGKDLESLDLADKPYLKHATNVWLFAFYFAGMRVSDVLRLKWTDIQNNRLYYSMGKNDKAGSIAIHRKALAILDQYKDEPQKNDLIFPELKVLDHLENKYDVQRKIAYAVKRLNKALALVSDQLGLTKKLTMHIARHTFGNISGDAMPIQMLQKLYRHSSITTTIGYQANFIHRDADKAVDDVIGF